MKKTQVINNANLAYLEIGKGHPIVLGHSYLWDTQMWHPQMDILQQSYYCLVPDLWSHGQSDPLPYAHYSIEQLTEDHWQLTQILGLKKFALIGLSVGGMWATQMALTYPDAVSALVLMDTYVGSEPEMTQKVYLSMMDELAKSNRFTSDFANKVAPYFFGKNTAKEQPKLVNDFIQSLIHAPPNHITGKVELGRTIFTRNSLLDQLAQIRVPTLVIVGEEDTPRPPSEAEEMAKRILGAEIEIIPKAGHISTLEQPYLVNRALMRFLNKVLL